MATVLTIAGVDSGGGAGISADLKTFAALGVHGTSVVTSVTAQNTKGVLDSYDIPAAFIEKQFDAVVSDIRIDCAKTGMLSSPEIVRTVAKLVRKNKLPLVIDPVMTAEAGGKLLRDEAVSVLIVELLPLATVITPNVFEASVLSGIEIKAMKDAEKAAVKIYELGAGAVIVTGGHLAGTDILYNGKTTYVEGKLVEGGGTHGSGCTHSAAITAGLAKGYGLVDAAILAKRFVGNAIRNGVRIGGGVAPVNPVGKVFAESDRYRVLVDVEEAVELVAKNMDSGLVAEVGCNIAMGIEGAKSETDVAAVSGRIVRLNDAAHPVGCVSFGASSHIARIVLTAMHYDSSMRAAMNIKYSQEALFSCSQLGFSVSSFRRQDEPGGISTMEWGIADTIKREGRVPDVIYDKGGVGKEAMIRLLGREAMEVAERAVRIGAMMRITPL
ncbi:MAG: bifunctional hydroxymethylpyrimidine kinase/phosphomethylpyrimidine kinase [Candidatus Methanoperedens sp.]